MDHRIVVGGETLVDFIPGHHGSLASVETFSRRAGGAPANVAVGLARLDEVPWFWTRVGSDAFGDFLADTLAEEGLPDRFVERDSDRKTTLAFVAHDEDADREFSFYRDGTADTRLQRGTVDDAVLADAETVYVGGVPLASEPARSATLDFAQRAGDQDCTVWFDPNARPELWTEGEFPDLFDRTLDLADVVKATPEDLRAAGVAGDSPENLAAAVCERGPHTTLLTLGSEGSLAYATDDAPWGATNVTHGGYLVDPVDATGAGDAFTAGAMAAVAEGLAADGLRDVIAFANAVAALTTTAKGAMTALPTREAVEDFRADREE